MQQEVTIIIAKYTNLPVDQVTEQTVIDRSVMASSILLHRMYAQLAAEGFAVTDYSAIRTVGQLLAALQPGDGNNAPAGIQPPIQYDAAASFPPAGVGIDVEQVDNLPQVNDFREESFYTMNFSSGEIAYCILQPSPYHSFAGLFAAKEAIVKADNQLKKISFNAISIDHLPGGQPVYPGFQLSISHSGNTATAVAIKSSLFSLPPNPAPTVAAGNSGVSGIISLIALFTALLSLLLLIIKTC